MGSPSERPRWGIPASLADKVWLMENGHLPRDEALIDKYKHQKYLATLAFYEQMEQDISDWKRSSN